MYQEKAPHTASGPVLTVYISGEVDPHWIGTHANWLHLRRGCAKLHPDQCQLCISQERANCTGSGPVSTVYISGKSASHYIRTRANSLYLRRGRPSLDPDPNQEFITPERPTGTEYGPVPTVYISGEGDPDWIPYHRKEQSAVDQDPCQLFMYQKKAPHTASGCRFQIFISPEKVSQTASGPIPILYISKGATPHSLWKRVNCFYFWRGRPTLHPDPCCLYLRKGDPTLHLDQCQLFISSGKAPRTGSRPVLLNYIH